jgi:hypothetical protein
MGLLAADLTGFGAVAYQEAWIYLDRSHLQPLTAPNSLADFQDRGGQYLFARYLHDLYGDSMIAGILSATTTGAASIEGVTGVPFAEFVADWAMALTVSGRLNSGGGVLVLDAALPNFRQPIFLSVSDVAVPGDPLGANGFQQGFNVRGPNLTFTGGSAPDGPTELEHLRVVATNLDVSVYHPQAAFHGSVVGGYGTFVVLVDGLTQEVNSLLIETAEGLDLIGRVVRLTDASPHAPSLTLEEVDGAMLTTIRPLDTASIEGGLSGFIPGVERRVIGRIDPPESILVASAFDPADPPLAVPLMSPSPVFDTDRYSFTLPAAATLGVQVERRYSDTSGNGSLADPFVAVILASDLPNPWNYPEWGFGPSLGDCAAPVWFDYPNVVPDWVYAQGVVVPDPTPGAWFETVVGWSEDAEFPSDVAGCSFDHDLDGVPDFFEALPVTLIDQIRQRQAENLAVDPSFYEDPWSLLPNSTMDFTVPFFNADFLDLDSSEWPDDDFATSLPALSLGGRAVAGGEEAVWTGTLPPGDYILLVGATGGSTGPYELSIRILE